MHPLQIPFSSRARYPHPHLQMSRQQPIEEEQPAPDHTQGLRQAVCSTMSAPGQSFEGSKERGRERRGKKGEAQVSHFVPIKDNWSTTPQDPSQVYFHSRFSIAYAPPKYRSWETRGEVGHDRLWCHSASPTPGTKPNLKLSRPRCWSPSKTGFLQKMSQKAGPPLPLESAELLNEAPLGTFQTSKLGAKIFLLKVEGRDRTKTETHLCLSQSTGYYLSETNLKIFPCGHSGLL